MPDFLQRITSDAIEGNAVGIGQLSVPMDGSPGQVLATNGNGVLMWVDQTAGSGSGSGSGSINVACADPNTVLLIHSDSLNSLTPSFAGYVTGDRRSTITITDDTPGQPAGLIEDLDGATSNLVDGVTDTNGSTHACTFHTTPASGRYLRFQFSTAKIVTEAKWYQGGTATHGVWKWQGSNDGTTFTDIGNSFTLGGTLQTQTELNGNTTAYTYYQLLGISGSASGTAWIREVEFNVVGQGDRTGSITVTTNESTSGSITNLVNGLTGENGYNTSNSCYFTPNNFTVSGKYIRFQFSSTKVITVTKLYNQNAGGEDLGTWKWQGSNDGTTWTDISDSYILANNTSPEITSMSLSGTVNTTSYTYYQLLGVSGTGNSEWISEIEFFEGGTIIDSSSSNHAITTVGNAQHSTTTSQFGGSSLYFDGNASSITVADSSQWEFSGDFTIECWMNKASKTTQSNIIGPVAFTAGNGWAFYTTQTSGVIKFFDYSNGFTLNAADADSGFQANTWHHVAVVRTGSTLKLYLDGVEKHSAGGYTATLSNFQDLQIGDDVNSNQTTYEGFLDEIRLSNVARYTSNFTPSTTAFCQSSTTSSGYPGTIAGYTSGGIEVNNQPSSEVVDRFAFASTSASVDVGNLTVRRDNPSGQNSSTDGYTSGGHGGPGQVNTNVIDKYNFLNNGDSTDVGDLTVNRHASCGQSSSTDGFISGGLSDGDPGVNEDVVDKFSFSSNNDATAHSNLTVARYGVTGHSSDTHGWTTGGTIINQSNTANSITSNIIERFSFASQNSEADIDDLSLAKSDCSGHSSSTDGYSSGGSSTSITARIDKFSFSSTTTSTNVGNISFGRNGAAGSSSTTHGYTSGGVLVTTTSGVNHLNTIDRFSYTTSGSDFGTDVGDLTVPRSSCSGTHY